MPKESAYKQTSISVTIASFNYDPFGLRISNSAPTIYMPLGFGGTYYDSETGLYFAQQRYYDPVTGRFTTKAPNLMAALLLQHRCLKGWKTTGPSSVILHMAPG